MELLADMTGLCDITWCYCNNQHLKVEEVGTSPWERHRGNVTVGTSPWERVRRICEEPLEEKQQRGHSGQTRSRKSLSSPVNIHSCFYPKLLHHLFN